MNITKIKGADTSTIVSAIAVAFSQTRFTLNIDESGRGIKILNVRLTEKKPYCGNHAKACERPHVGKHKKAQYLEGADWVEFNDRLNSVLDELNVSARVDSGTCNLRKGTERRISYQADTFAGGAWQWNKFGRDDEYADYTGHKVLTPISKFPMGTPGIYEAAGYNVEG
jgi:hypothetical protein